jgi:6-pyruvoyltetrahydropterin/6-carboxytetrahydropterin synthase
MYTIRKRFTFSAAHHLHDLPPTHPCSRPHGHNYIVEVRLKSPGLSSVCFVRDYRDLDKFKTWLDETCDHRDLNEVFSGMQTTAENLAYRFWEFCKSVWPECCSVAVSETPKTWAEFEEDEI